MGTRDTHIGGEVVDTAVRLGGKARNIAGSQSPIKLK